MTVSDSRYVPAAREKAWWAGLLAGTLILCGCQIAWFWRFRAHNITMDGIAYIGLARHLADGDFVKSLHGYRSPLTSWLIAAGALLSRNYTLVGRLVTIGSFLLCLPLLYVLTHRLWRSRVAAGLAVFWFAAARGLISLAVGSILADFVLTACALSYFLLLLGALRLNTPRSWLLVGVAHGITFLAKAIAMPWLAILSATALLARNLRAPRRLATLACLGFLIPGIVWVAWGKTLRLKYGVFTTGYQLRANLMIDWNRRLSHFSRGDSLAYSENPSLYDDYMVADSWASVRNFSLRNGALLNVIAENELGNMPQAVKELMILLTPAGALSLPIMVVLLLRRRKQYDSEATFACIVVLGAASLIGAYCMLVFDGRYIIPITPVLIAVSCPLMLPADLVPDAPRLPVAAQRAGLALLALGLIFFAAYWASPLRTVDRDFEESCYQAANSLREAAPPGALVSVGQGPYPEHGVGFEVGPYVAYLSGWRLLGGNAALPAESQADSLAAKVIAGEADAAAVWGSPGDPAYLVIIRDIKQAPDVSQAIPFSDAHKGEVGTLFLFRRKNQAR